ncbi:MAG: amidoligase family protein [Eubacteriaceae bacterium]|nr:amidoligase family protein [Eubacteriaceae bacterium]
MKNQKYGIEIEMTGITRATAASCVAKYFSTRYSRAYGVYDTYLVPDQSDRTWKVMYDGSIRPQEYADGHLTRTTQPEYKVELVSPILCYEDIETLQEIIRLLFAAGARCNKSCGIHVHVDASAYKPQTLRNIINIVAAKEDLLYKALNVDPSRVCFCKKVNSDLIDSINRHRPKTMDELRTAWYAEFPYNTRGHYNDSRYHGLNLHATFTKGTIEFRLFNGTLHAGKIKTYIQLSLAISHQALTQSRASSRKVETTNEKYAFRCWLLRLGLIGPEFKTCRYHLLKALEGNSAWRYIA